MRKLLPILTCLIVSVLSLGCKDPQVDAPKQEHEHFPVHWPQDIMSASKRLSQLLTDPRADSSVRSTAEHWPQTAILGAKILHESMHGRASGLNCYANTRVSHLTSKAYRILRNSGRLWVN